MGESQGQKGLFAAAPFMSAEKRYPRGYTPGRMAEVRKGMSQLRPTGEISSSGTAMLAPQSTIEPPLFPDTPETERMRPGIVAGINGVHERGVHEAIARSTVPARVLRSVSKIKTDPEGLANMNAGGYYEPDWKTIATHRMTGSDSRYSRDLPKKVSAEISAKKQRQDDTLIHELGHHTSFMDKARNAARSSYPLEKDSRGLNISGPEEAYADDFMVRHRRQDPRDVKQNGASAPDTYLSSGTLHHGNRSYVDARQHWGSEIEQQIGRSNDQWDADRDTRVKANRAASARDGEQGSLLGVVRYGKVVGDGVGNHLNGKQFGET